MEDKRDGPWTECIDQLEDTLVANLASNPISYKAVFKILVSMPLDERNAQIICELRRQFDQMERAESRGEDRPDVFSFKEMKDMLFWYEPNVDWREHFHRLFVAEHPGMHDRVARVTIAMLALHQAHYYADDTRIPSCYIDLLKAFHTAYDDFGIARGKSKRVTCRRKRARTEQTDE